MNTELMANVRQVILEHPSRHDQNIYIETARGGVTLGELRRFAFTDVPPVPATPERPICQTTACVAGWAVILAGPADFTSYGTGVLMRGDSFYDTGYEARKLLGISEECAFWLFSGGRSREAVLWALDWLPRHQDALMADLRNAVIEQVASVEWDEESEEICDPDEPVRRGP